MSGPCLRGRSYHLDMVRAAGSDERDVGTKLLRCASRDIHLFCLIAEEVTSLVLRTVPGAHRTQKRQATARAREPRLCIVNSRC